MKTKALLKKGLLFGLTTLLFSIIISFIVGEFIVKHTMPQETYPLARMVGLHFFEESPIIPFTLRKNIKDFVHISFTREFTHKASTNSLGTRGKDFSKDKKEGTYRILFLGDSMTFGWGVEDDQTYPALVEKYLNDSGVGGKYSKVETINAGFADGWSIDDYYVYYKEIGSKFKPDLVIVDFFPYNDISDMMEQVWEKVDSKGYPEKIISTTHKVEGEYLVSRKKTNWKLEFPVLRNYHLGILFMNALEKASPETVRKIESILGISHEKELVPIEERLSCIYSMIEKNCPAVLWSNVDKAKLILTGFKEVTKENNHELLVTIMASPDQAVPLSEKKDRLKLLTSSEPQKYFREYMDKEGIRYLDLLPVLSEGNAQRYFFKQDGHLNKEGHQQVAREIVKFLQEMNSSVFPKPKS